MPVCLRPARLLVADERVKFFSSSCLELLPRSTCSTLHFPRPKKKFCPSPSSPHQRRPWTMGTTGTTASCANTIVALHDDFHHPSPIILAPGRGDRCITPRPAIPDSQPGPQADRRGAVRLHVLELPSRNQRKTRREITMYDKVPPSRPTTTRVAVVRNPQGTAAPVQVPHLLCLSAQYVLY